MRRMSDNDDDDDDNAHDGIMIIVSRQQASKIQSHSLRIGNIDVKAVSNVRNLGVQFDSEMSMAAHINATCRAVYFQIRNISSIRKSLSDKVTASIIHSYVMSRLDYGNGLLFNVTSIQLAKLQRAQNAAARVLSKTSKFSHISPILKQLHWLPVRERVKFKILLLTWKAVNGCAPQYLVNLISEYVPRRNLRSSGSGMLASQIIRSSVGEKAFAVCAPTLWNALPSRVRNVKTLDAFKTGLKTFLFSFVYD